MKKNKLHIASLLLAAALYTACSVVDPMADEQYQKDIYIVGANDKVLSFNVPYGNAQEAFVSISASGSQKVDKDVNVSLKPNNEIISWYNGKYMLDTPVKYKQVDTDLINVSSWTVTLEAGEVYTRLPFTINTSNLHCDSLHAIGFAIESVSDYDISQTGKELIFTLKLTNPYSGNYHLDASKTLLKEEAQPDGSTLWVEQGMPLPVSIQRTLTAVSENTVRFFHEKNKETLAEYSNSWNPEKDYFDAISNLCLQFVKTDGNNFDVLSWENFAVVNGTATFADDSFTFQYDYDEGNNRYRMKGVFRK